MFASDSTQQQNILCVIHAVGNMPGVNKKALILLTGLKQKRLQTILASLVKHRHVISYRSGGQEHYFPSQMQGVNHEAYCLLQYSDCALVLNAVTEQPSAEVKEYADSCGLEYNTTLRILKRLSDAGFLDCTKGRQYSFRPTNAKLSISTRIYYFQDNRLTSI